MRARWNGAGRRPESGWAAATGRSRVPPRDRPHPRSRPARAGVVRLPRGRSGGVPPDAARPVERPPVVTGPREPPDDDDRSAADPAGALAATGLQQVRPAARAAWRGARAAGGRGSVMHVQISSPMNPRGTRSVLEPAAARNRVRWSRKVTTYSPGR